MESASGMTRLLFLDSYFLTPLSFVLGELG